MRIWTIHPSYLDAKGLVAVWREALLAQKVLRGLTTGYRHHPQLVRFRAQPDPLAAIATYLAGVAEEAHTRGYRFDTSKIGERRTATDRVIEETDGQLRYEWQHLLAKLQHRDPPRHRRWKDFPLPRPHPLFTIVAGEVQDWERRQGG